MAATDDNLSTHALAYAQQGFEVFPCSANKVPLTEHGMKDATSTPEVVEAWWSEHPTALIGCRIPESQIVLDIDPKNSGLTTWKKLKATYGELPSTRTHASGRGDGGGHIWYQRPTGKLSIKPLNQWARDNGVGQAVGNHSWISGIDLLHHGHRYTILPPSPHPATGKPYRWLEDRGPDLAPATMPSWLAELVTEPPADPAWTRPSLTVVKPGWNDSIADWFTETTSWGDLLVPEGWTVVRGDGESDGSRWRHPNASAEWSATIRHGCLFVYSTSTDFEPTGDGDPNGYTRFRAWATLCHRGNLQQAARAAMELRDGPKQAWVLSSGVGGEEVPEGTGEPADPLDLDRLHGKVDWVTFWRRDRNAQDWVAEPFLVAKRAHALYAPGKTGKSLFALSTVAALATGQAVLRQPVGEPINVVYLDYEMTEDDLYDRLVDMGYGPEVGLSHFHYYLLPNLAPLDTAEGGRELMEILRNKQADLVVVDTTARAVAGEENNADTLRGFYRHTGMLLKQAEITSLRVDHAGKDLARGQRGTSAKNDDVDIVWQMTPDENGVMLKATHRRLGWVPEAVHYRRGDEPYLHYVPAPSGWPAGTAEAARLLDKHGVELDASIRVARKVLSDAGDGHRQELVRMALKWRREGADQRWGTGPETPVSGVSQMSGHTRNGNRIPGPGTHSDTPPKSPGDSAGHTSGYTGTHPPLRNGIHASPPRGTQYPAQGSASDVADDPDPNDLF